VTRRRGGPGRRAIVLLSGGMDSATCLAELAIDHEVFALTVGYGQRHARELRSARGLADRYRVREHIVIEVPMAGIARSALIDRRRSVPASGPRPGRIPSTYVPARNTILLGLALALAESVSAETIALGVNAIDYSGYPDCRPEFLRAFERLAQLATRAGVRGHRIRIHAPLLRLTKAGIVRRGDRLGVPWELTWSCYLGGRRPCGTCDACRLRARGFAEAGRTDPALATRLPATVR
jgi:7-cyano-7-deazaguanine synthase